VNVLDVVIVVLVVGAVARGVASGVAVQLLSYLGLGVGLVLGALLAPWVTHVTRDASWRTLITLATVFGLGLAGGAVGSRVGTSAGHQLRRLHLGSVDSVLGGVVAAASVLVSIWLFAASFAATNVAGLGGLIQRSVVVQRLDAALPAVPDVAARLGRLVDPLGFPRVFAGLEPSVGQRVAGPTDAAVQAAANAAAASTVKIEGRGCGGVLDGSGFVAEAGLVITNAHVVAGVQRPSIIDGRGRHNATVVLFDPQFDLAVLRSADVTEPPLSLSGSTVGRSAGGAVLGYPGGGPFTVGAAAVLTDYEAIGRDIYGRGLITRHVYQLQAVVRPGNSGGPLVLADGSVAGVVFARSVTNDDIGYALAADGVRTRLASAEAASAPVPTGACVGD